MLHARTGVLARSRRSSSRWWTIISRSADTYSVRLTFNSRMEETRRANTVYRIGWRNQLVKPRERHTHTHTHTHARTHANIHVYARTVEKRRRERHAERTFEQKSWPRMGSEMRSSDVEFNAECGDLVSRKFPILSVHSLWVLIRGVPFLAIFHATVAILIAKVVHRAR